MSAADFVFAFEKGDGRNKMLFGGKGANLCEMTQIGLNVPPGFVISTAACLAYQDQGRLSEGLMAEVRKQLAEVEHKTGRKFGSAADPLLVSVRSGSAMSMPGMMDTILNLGLNEASLGGLIKATGNPRFGYDAWRRFVQLFGKVALGVPDAPFDEAMTRLKQRRRCRAGRRSLGRRSEGAGERLPGHRAGGHRQAVSERPLRATGDRDRRGVPLVDGQARGRLPAPVPHHAADGQRHRGQRGARWCSATWARTARPASASRATRLPART